MSKVQIMGDQKACSCSILPSLMATDFSNPNREPTLPMKMRHIVLQQICRILCRHTYQPEIFDVRETMIFSQDVSML